MPYVPVHRIPQPRRGDPARSAGLRLRIAPVLLEARGPDGSGAELAHEHPDFAAYTEREIRSAQRASAKSVLVPNRMRCGGCNAWVGAANERHSCGFHNDIRGNRNHGRWAEGTSRIAAAMPF